MKILFLCHRFPYPADGGGKIRALELIRHLSAQHEVHVVSMLRGAQEARDADGLSRWCAQWHAPQVGKFGSALSAGLSVLRGRSLSEGYFGAASVRRAVRQQLARHRYDRIVVHCSSMAPHAAGVSTVPRLLDLCDLDSAKWRMYAERSRGWRRWLYAYEQAAVARLEARMVADYELTTVATPNELAALLEQIPAARADWFPNGVDLDYFTPLPAGPDQDTLCFIGRMDYLPNERAVVMFCSDVLPRVRAERAQARFLIIGANPTDAVRRLADIDGVTVTGSVDDVRPWLARGRAMVAPLQIARGVQNKILESMAMGVPVLTSRLAAQGVDAVIGEHLLCADEPQSMADACIRLLSDEVHWQSVRDAGLARVRERYGWSQSLGRLDGMLAAIGEATE